MKNEQTKSVSYENNNDDRLFIAEKEVISKLAENSCVIVGRCADYILKDDPNVFKVFLYSDLNSEVERAINYYGLSPENALKEINRINKERAKHYKFYTNKNWKDFSNYDCAFNVDKYGVEKTASNIIDIIKGL